MPDIDIQPSPGPRRFQCRHIFTDGHRCGSPCLRGEEFCFYHHSARGRRAVPTDDLSQGEHRASSFTVPNPEDRSAIQVAIGEILNRLAANELDPRRAGLLLYGLQIASVNLPQGRPAGTPPQPVEDTVTDPDLGTLALTSEILPEGAKGPSTILAQLLHELRRGKPTEPRP